MKNLSKVILILIFLLILAAIMSSIYHFHKNRENIVYGWEEKYINLETFKEYNITTLYQEYSKDFLSNKGKLIYDNTYFLCGDPSWAIDKASHALEFVDLVAKYNKDNDKKFKGIVFDIESYSSSDFKSFEEYEKNLIKIYNYAKSKGFYVVMVIPYWLEGGVLESIIKNGCDRISIMNYKMEDAHINIKKHYKLAKKYNKEIDCIFELHNGYSNLLVEYNKYLFMDVNFALHDTSNLKIK